MILFFIPSLDDHDLVSNLVESLLIAHPESKVLVVDDGSKFPLALTIHESLFSRAVLYRLEKNAGLGLATSIAIDFFLQESFSVLVRVDADGQHPLSEVSKLYDPILNGSADIVWAERLGTDGSAAFNYSLAVRELLKAITRWLAQTVIGCLHSDWFSGFFAMGRQAAQVFQSDYLERYCEVQMLCLAYKRHLRIRTVLVHQIERIHGESTIRLFSGLMLVLRAWLFILASTSNKERR